MTSGPNVDDRDPEVSVGGLAVGFGAGAVIIIGLAWIGGAAFHGEGTMPAGMMFSDGSMATLGSLIFIVVSAMILGAIVAGVINAIGLRRE